MSVFIMSLTGYHHGSQKEYRCKFLVIHDEARHKYTCFQLSAYQLCFIMDNKEYRCKFCDKVFS